MVYYLATLGMTDLNRDGQPRPDNYYQAMTVKECESTAKMVASARHLFSFLVGGVLGAVMVHELTFWSSFVDIAMLMFMSFDLYFADQQELREANYKAIEKEVPLQVVPAVDAVQANSPMSITDETLMLVQLPKEAAFSKPQEESKV